MIFLSLHFSRPPQICFTLLLQLFVLGFCPVDAAENAPLYGKIPVYGYEVVSRFPHDPEAFTQGLAYDDGFLYEGTGLHGRSSLRRIALDGDGKEAVVRRLPDHFFGEGVTVFKGKVIQLTWKSRVGIVWNKKNLTLERLFSYPAEGWGITHDGGALIMSDGSATLYFLDPDSFKQVKKVNVTDHDGPVPQLNELEYVRGEIWANIWKETRIARIDPASGRVVGWIEFAPLAAAEAPAGEDNVLNGIAYDSVGDRIFVTGKRWPTIFEIKVIPVRD